MPAGIRRPGIQRPIVQIDDRLVPTHSRASSFAAPIRKLATASLVPLGRTLSRRTIFTAQKNGPGFRGQVFYDFCATSFHLSRASITDAACLDDHATAR